MILFSHGLKPLDSLFPRGPKVFPLEVNNILQFFLCVSLLICLEAVRDRRGQGWGGPAFSCKVTPRTAAIALSSRTMAPVSSDVGGLPCWHSGGFRGFRQPSHPRGPRLNQSVLSVPPSLPPSFDTGFILGLVLSLINALLCPNPLWFKCSSYCYVTNPINLDGLKQQQ